MKRRNAGERSSVDSRGSCGAAFIRGSSEIATIFAMEFAEANRSEEKLGKAKQSAEKRGEGF